MKVVLWNERAPYDDVIPAEAGIHLDSAVDVLLRRFRIRGYDMDFRVFVRMTWIVVIF